MFNWFKKNKESCTNCKAHDNKNIIDLVTELNNVKEENNICNEKTHFNSRERGSKITLNDGILLKRRIVGYTKVKTCEIVLETFNEVICVQILNQINGIIPSDKFPSISAQIIEQKVNAKEDKGVYKITYTRENDGYWYSTLRNKLYSIQESDLAAINVFVDKFHSKYKLIGTIEELDNYISSTLSCDDWCRLKLVNKMKELNLGDGFINAFADLIGNDLNKYHQMIDLANECNDIDTLMYMYTCKFGNKQ